jgi:hypothetical protein
MDDILRGLDLCFAYLDHILVFSRSLEEHENHLRILVDQIQRYGIFINHGEVRLPSTRVHLPRLQGFRLGVPTS